MSRITRFLLLAFPRGWRDRYGSELEALTADVRLTPGVAADLVRSGVRQRVEGVRGEPGVMLAVGPAWRHPTGFAWIAALLLTPTALFVAGSLMAYGLNVRGLRDVMDAAGGWLDGVGFANALLVLAVPASAVLALLPMLRLGRHMRGAGGVGVVLQPRLANAAAVVAALAVSAALAWYAAAELGGRLA